MEYSAPDEPEKNEIIPITCVFQLFDTLRLCFHGAENAIYGG